MHAMGTSSGPKFIRTSLLTPPNYYLHYFRVYLLTDVTIWIPPPHSHNTLKGLRIQVSRLNVEHVHTLFTYVRPRSRGGYLEPSFAILGHNDQHHTIYDAYRTSIYMERRSGAEAIYGIGGGTVPESSQKK